MANEIRYRAFISYSHHDAGWARWLQTSLEQYRAPKDLSGRNGQGRPLAPIFRDQSELAASGDLGRSIRAALDRSDYLILVCSPASRASHWVLAELDHFLNSRDVDRVLCVVVGGDRALAIRDGLPARLCDALSADRDPLAADLRPGGDGRRVGRLKLAAALLGVGLDRLIQRDAARRGRWMIGMTTAALVFSAFMGGSLYITMKAGGLAQRRSAQSDELIAFMLGDLRQRLEPVGRLDILDDVGRKVLSHYAQMDEGSLDDVALAKQAKALKLVGSIRLTRGDLPGAAQAFRQADATARGLVERAPDDGERVYDEAQGVYWLAMVQWRLGRIDAAERGFRDYARLADQLMAIDPRRMDWFLETAYAQSNLGTLLVEQGRYREALAAFRTALAGFQTAWLKDPHNADRLADLVDAHNWVGDTLYRLGRLEDAYHERLDAATALRQQVRLQPDNRPLLARSWAADLALGRLALDLGNTTESRARMGAARLGLAALIRYDPENATWLEYAAIADLDAVDNASAGAAFAQAQALNTMAGRKIGLLKKMGAAAYRWQPQIEGRWQVQAAALLRRGGDEARSRRIATAILQSSRGSTSRDHGANTEFTGFAQLLLDHPAAALAVLSPDERQLPPGGLDALAQAAAAMGDTARARRLLDALAREGYRRRPLDAFLAPLSPVAFGSRNP